MKVCHITTVHPQNDNRIFYKECISLKKEGYDVTLLVAGGLDHIIDGVKIISLKKEKNRIKGFFKTSIYNGFIAALKINADVYHFHDPELLFLGLMLKFKGKIVIYDIHENNSASILSKPYLKSQFLKESISRLFNFFEKNIIHFFDAIVTARPDITEKFKHLKIITLRNFPILELNKSDLKINSPDKKTVIYVGGMSKIRGTEILIDAFNAMPEYNLWLLGPIKENNIKNKIENSKENIKYHGIVEPFEVLSYIQKADIGIVTFLAVPNHIKTLATKPFEYMACGKPMIMSNFKYWEDTFRESSLYVDPLSKNEIINATQKLMIDYKLNNKMSKLNIRLSNEKYNWESESKKLINLYQNL